MNRSDLGRDYTAFVTLIKVDGSGSMNDSIKLGYIRHDFAGEHGVVEAAKRATKMALQGLQKPHEWRVVAISINSEKAVDQ